MTETQSTGTYGVFSEPSMIGVVLGSYRITSEIGVGGMGRVFRAEHALLASPAAIKLLRPELTSDAELVERFFNEAKATTAIRHPGIIEIYDFGYTAAGHAYLVMELLDGSPLSHAVAARRGFPPHEAIAITRAIASALKAAHETGIIHRDLKPDNVFLIRDADAVGGLRIKVLDFGIAKLTSPDRDHRRTQTGVLLGTPRYMAPEQAREAGAIDHRADLYSLGCILYELLVGRPPFVAEGAGEVIALQLFADPEPPSQLAEISPELEQLVLRLLAKEPAARPGSAAEVMEALAQLGGAPSTPRPSEVTEALRDARRASVSRLDPAPPITPAPRGPALAIAVGLFVIASAAIVAFVVTRAPEAPRAAPPIEVAAPPPVMEAPPTAAEPTRPAVAPIGTTIAPELPRRSGKQPPRKMNRNADTRRPAGHDVAPSQRRPTTENHSPIETTLDDAPKRTP